MQLKRFIDDDDAVSPVIGVILMVAITVILAAVIATFVLGLGEQISDTGPQANFDFEYDSSSSPGTLTITHTDGEQIEAQELYIRGDESGSWSTYSSATRVSAGSEVEVGGVAEGDTIRVVWEGDGGNTATLQVWEG